MPGGSWPLGKDLHSEVLVRGVQHKILILFVGIRNVLTLQWWL